MNGDDSIHESIYTHPDYVRCIECLTFGKWEWLGGFAEALKLKCKVCGNQQYTWW